MRSRVVQKRGEDGDERRVGDAGTEGREEIIERQKCNIWREIAKI